MASRDSRSSDHVQGFTQATITSMSGVESRNAPSKQTLGRLKRPVEDMPPGQLDQDKNSRKTAEDSDNHTDGDSNLRTGDNGDDKAGHSELSSSDTSEDGRWGG